MNRRLLELLWMPCLFVPVFLLLLTARAVVLNGVLGDISKALRVACEAVTWFLTGGVPSLGDSLMIAWALVWLTFMWLMMFPRASLRPRRDRPQKSHARNRRPFSESRQAGSRRVPTRTSFRTKKR